MNKVKMNMAFLVIKMVNIEICSLSVGNNYPHAGFLVMYCGNSGIPLNHQLSKILLLYVVEIIACTVK